MRTDRKELFRVRFEQHYPRLCSIAYGYVSDYDESEDIVQELFIYIWDKGKDCLPEQELTAYLTTAVKNRCISFLRRKKEDTVSIEDYPLADHHLADETADSSENRRSPEEVLGTSFLVDATQTERTGVFVESGRVKVSAEDHDLVLHAHEKAELSDGNLQKGTIDDPASFFNRKKTKMVFNQTPLKDVIKEVEKQTGIRIELGRGVEENTVTTRIDPDNAEGIAAELAFLCGCKCDTLKRGKLYRLRYD